MTKIFGNLSCADIVCEKRAYSLDFVDDKYKEN